MEKSALLGEQQTTQKCDWMKGIVFKISDCESQGLVPARLQLNDERSTDTCFGNER